ncbi:MAG TPA: L,D-transpeptidase family protein [Sphingomicrobium sp.]|nr:L,D-transpeptidase family protein [Sphingomicrobium sp.]
MKSQLLGQAAIAALGIAPAPALAVQVATPVPPPALVATANLPIMASVSSFYDQYKTSIWFKGGTVAPAAAQLVTILRRAPIEGLSFGPQLADQIEAAVRQASSGAPADVANAERVLSSALVTYVQALKRPTPGMIYAYPVLSPQGGRADQILLTAAAAPSLEVYLSAASNINPIYASIRDAAFRQAQVAGNLTPDPRLLANLERARTLPARGKFALVDSASQRLFMYENGQVVDSMKVVVGDKDKLGLPTPLIASVMHYMTFNPYWNVPHHLVRKSVAPGYLKQGGAKYLKARGYEVMSDWTENATVVDPDTVDWKAVLAGDKQIRVRQLPGPTNSMGKMKFPFPNGQDIFLHDTPAREHFAKSQRTISNGCVRLEDAKRFARWLLGREPVAPSAETEIRVQLPAGVPIYLTYLTAQPTESGLTYLKDVYGWDQPSAYSAGTQPTGVPTFSTSGGGL